MASILIVGAFPPPIGGNSVHIERLYRMLVQDKNLCKVIDLYGSKNIQENNPDIFRLGRSKILGLIETLFLMRTLQYDIVHFHVSSMRKFLYVGILYILFVKNKSIRVVTIHSGSFPKYIQSLSVLKKKFLKLILSRFNGIIAVSKEIQKSLIEINIDSKITHVIPAFLPSKPTTDKSYENIISCAKNKNRKIVLTSGYAKEIYQYETIIEAISSSHYLNERIVFVVCVYNEIDEKYYSFIKNKLKSIEEYFLFENLDPDSFSNLLMKSDIYIRATTYDGDCVAIREANYLGKDVIASDCVTRPEFCVLFETSNSLSLADALNKALENKEHEGHNMKAKVNYYEQILAVYRM